MASEPVTWSLQHLDLLITYIDGCSRRIPYAQFFASEKFDGLRVEAKEALIRRGKPTFIYTENGKVYRSKTLQYACADSGITLAHTQPYDPQSKRKIERFWRWFEEDYHRKVHASLEGKTPHDIFQSQLDQLTFLEDPTLLKTIFLKRKQRKIKADSTITLNKLNNFTKYPIILSASQSMYN